MDAKNTTVLDNNATDNYARGQKVPDNQIVSYSSKTTITVSTRYNLGDSITLSVDVETNSNNAFDGIVTITMGDYEDYLMPVNGHAVFTLNTVDIGEGSYVVYAKYSNDTHCAPSQTSKSFMILPMVTINAKNLKRGYNSTYDYYAVFYDFNHNRLAKTYVMFVVKGVQYKVKTNSKGVAKLKAKLAPGTYKILIRNLVTKESLTKKVKITKRIYAKNTKAYYNSGYSYKVKIFGNNGKLVGKGHKVKFKFNGKEYNVKTNKKGIAKLKISTKDNKPGKYKIRIYYKSYKVAKKITIKHVIHSKKISKLSKNDSSAKIKILLKSKKSIKK